MSTITITLPDDIRALVEEEANAKGYANLSDFFYDMICDYRNFQGEKSSAASSYPILTDPERRKKLDQLLLEGVRSEKFVADDAYWKVRLDRLRERHPELKGHQSEAIR